MIFMKQLKKSYYQIDGGDSWALNNQTTWSASNQYISFSKKVQRISRPNEKFNLELLKDLKLDVENYLLISEAGIMSINIKMADTWPTH